MSGAAAWLLAMAVLYAPVLWTLARDWSIDPAYSHGFLIAPIAAWVLWTRRHQLRTAAAEPARSGLLLVFGGLLLFVLGSLSAELFVMRASLIPVLAGTVLWA